MQVQHCDLRTLRHDAHVRKVRWRTTVQAPQPMMRLAPRPVRLMASILSACGWLLLCALASAIATAVRQICARDRRPKMLYTSSCALYSEVTAVA